MSEENEPVSYFAVFLAPEAERSYLDVKSKSALSEFDAVLNVLESTPNIGRVYDPAYEAARPDIDGLLVAYASCFGIYYVVDEENHRVVVLYIEDQRRDPNLRFYSE